MRSWRKKFQAEEPHSVTGSSSSKRNSVADPPVPVWVNHSPSVITDDDDDDDGNTTGRTSSTPPYAGVEEDDSKGSMKNKLKSLIPRSLGNMFHKRSSDSCDDSELSTKTFKILPNGTRVSPPVSPLFERKNCGGSLTGSSSQNSHKLLLTDNSDHYGLREESVLTSIHPAEHYAEKLEVYNQKYSYLKSWPGLLRLLAGLELLFGGMVIACVIAYVQKDSEWSNSYGLYNGVYNNGLGLSGYSYTGPMTPFILAVAGISWIVTFCLLVVGMTMIYRTILLNSPWWPLTEAFINVALFLLLMAAGIVYLNDLNRGGLCDMTIGVNPVMANLCRVDGGQMAGTSFIFINMTLYLGSFLVCLKMWRHEAARREREHFGNQHHEDFHQSIPLKHPKTTRISFKDEIDMYASKDSISPQENVLDLQENPATVRRNTAMEYMPKAYIVADYIMKFPEICFVEEREKYKAVFNDQYLEYKDLHRDITVTLSKFRELDVMMAQLLKDGKGQEDQQRIRSILKKYEQKKSDPSFLDKKERCDYLKAKLSHIKYRIHTFDQEMMTNAQT